MMQVYDIKRGHLKKINLKGLLVELFGDVTEEKEHFHCSYGALAKLEVWTEGNERLVVDLTMDKTVDAELARDSHSRWNDFLLQATSYNAKQRADRAKKKVKAITKAEGLVAEVERARDRLDEDTMAQVEALLRDLKAAMEDENAARCGSLGKKIEALL